MKLEGKRLGRKLRKPPELCRDQRRCAADSITSVNELNFVFWDSCQHLYNDDGGLQIFGLMHLTDLVSNVSAAVVSIHVFFLFLSA